MTTDGELLYALCILLYVLCSMLYVLNYASL